MGIFLLQNAAPELISPYEHASTSIGRVTSVELLLSVKRLLFSSEVADIYFNTVTLSPSKPRPVLWILLQSCHYSPIS